MNVIDLNKNQYQMIGKPSERNYGKIYSMRHCSHKQLVTVIECSILFSPNHPERILKEEAVKREIKILNELQKIINPPCKLLKYYGHPPVENNRFYYLFFEYMPISLTQILEENKRIGQCDYQLVFSVFDNLLRTLCFLQLMGITCPNIHHSNILLNANRSQIGLINYEIFRNDNAGSQILQASNNERGRNDFFKSDTYSFGLLIMEILISKEFDRDPRGVRNTLEEIKNIIPKDDEKKFMTLLTLLKDFLQEDARNRLNFRDGFLKKFELEKDDLEKNKFCILILESEEYPATFLDPNLEFEKYKSKIAGMKIEENAHYSSNLSSGLSRNNFTQNIRTRFLETENSILFTSSCSRYAIKVPKNQKITDMMREIIILQKIYYLPFAPQAFPEFHGHIKRTSHLNPLRLDNMLIFKFYKQTCRAYLESKPNGLGLDKINKCFVSILNALAFLENMGYSHGNLNSDNIMVDESENFKIIGWGKVSVLTQASIEKDVFDLLFLFLEMTGIFKSSSLNRNNQSLITDASKFLRQYDSIENRNTYPQLFDFLIVCVDNDSRSAKSFNNFILSNLDKTAKNEQKIKNLIILDERKLLKQFWKDPANRKNFILNDSDISMPEPDQKTKEFLLDNSVPNTCLNRVKRICKKSYKSISKAFLTFWSKFRAGIDKIWRCFSYIFSEVWFIFILPIFVFHIVSFVLFFEFFKERSLFEIYFDTHETVYFSIISILSLNLIKSIIFLFVFICLFGTFLEKLRHYVNFALCSLLGILELLHFFLRMIFLLGDDFLILNFINKIENSNDYLNVLSTNLKVMYYFEAFLEVFALIELPWCLRIALWALEDI